MASYNIVGRVDLKPLQKATKAFNKFDKQTQFWAKRSRKAYLAVSAAATYYSQKIVRESISAALADEKSQRQLALTLQDVAGANDVAVIAAEANIASMSKMFGIADDQLRPALATLARITGSSSEAFNGLNLALSLSVATGKDLNAVSTAIGRAYNGNLMSLKRLNLKLDENKVKNKDIQGILEDLRKTYGAFATKELDTTAKQFDRIKVAAGEAAEVIGNTLIQVLSDLTKSSGGINGIAKAMESAAFWASDFLVSLQMSFEYLQQNKITGPILKFFGRATKAAKDFAYWLSEEGRLRRINLAIQKASTAQVISARNAEMTALKAKKESFAIAEQGTKKTVEQLMAEEAARKAGFKLTEDIDSIQTVAAAKRLEEARQYKAQVLDAAQAQFDAVKTNYDLLNAVWETQLTAFDAFLAALKTKAAQAQIAVSYQGTGAGSAPTATNSIAAIVPAPAPAPEFLGGGGSFGTQRLALGGNTNVMNVSVNAFGTQDFLSAVQQAQQEFARNGWSTSYAGS